MTVYQGNIIQPHRIVPGRGAEFDTVPLEVRFWARVRKTETCWNWTKVDATGRGGLNINKRNKMAHRISWELHYGPIPKGLCVCHHCDNPSCVRPDHLFLGAQKENMVDCIRKGRKAVISSERRSEILRRPEVRAKRSKATGNLRWITDGVSDRRIKSELPIPEGWKLGRTFKAHLGHKHSSTSKQQMRESRLRYLASLEK